MSSNSLCASSRDCSPRRLIQILRALPEKFGLRGLRHQLLFEVGDAAAEIFDPAALFGQFLRGGFEFDALGVAAVFHRLEFVAGVGEPFFQRFDLRLEGDDLDLLGIGHARTLVERAGELGEFGLPVGQRALGLMHDGGLGRDFVFGRAQLIAQRLVARFQRKNGGGLFAELHLEPVDGVAFFADLGELAGGLGLELLDAHFETPRRHGEFGAQLIFVGLDFRHRQRGGGFQPPHGQPHRAAMHEGNDDEPGQGRDQEPDPEIHDRFDHK